MRLYSLFKSDGLNTNSKLTIHKALIGSIMTYACPAWEFAADTHLLKLHRLENKVLRTTGKFFRDTPIREYIPSNSIRIRFYKEIMQATSQSHSTSREYTYMFAILGKEKPDIENIRDLNLAVVRHMIV
jgi:hypothetical protein